MFMKNTQIKIGDIFEIPLSESRKSFGQYVFADDKVGPLIRVFDIVVPDNEILDLDKIVQKPLRFPPIIAGVVAAIRRDFWKKLGNIPVKDFVYPKFVSTLYDGKTGKPGTWFLWDGKKSIDLGNKLPEEYKDLEYLIVWNPNDVTQRVQTGYYPFPYRDLIENNEFVPKQPS
jgi:hypothetical protein